MITGSRFLGQVLRDIWSQILSLSLLALYEMKLLPPTCSNCDDFLKTWVNMNIYFLGVFLLVPLSQLQNAKLVPVP